MIERLYIRELLSFKEVKIEFDNGLVVLTGPSGAGKSVLMQSILSSFGHGDMEATVCEVMLSKPGELSSESYELDDDLVIKSIKKDRARFYLNEQNISKRSLKTLFAPYINYLSVRDKSGFESERLVGILDDSIGSGDGEHFRELGELETRYGVLTARRAELQKIYGDEKKLAELIEFAEYEIGKIRSIDPKVGEDITLLQTKQQLSRIDKVNELLENATQIFEYESSVQEIFRLLEKDDSYFTDMMNQLRADLDDTQNLSDELVEVDVENILDRLEQISSLKNRYGSIEEALEYKRQKEEELLGYTQIDRNKKELESFLEKEGKELRKLADRVSKKRKKKAKELEQELSSYLHDLKLPAAKFVFKEQELDGSGIDTLDLTLGSSSTSTLSGGEFNRLRLALLVVAMGAQNVRKQGVIILDEIDANVSGDESIAIAAMIAKLAKGYQLFAISHQAHLSSQASQHILVSKEGNQSRAKVLCDEERISEIARIIGGKNPDAEAVAFARKLRGAS